MLSYRVMLDVPFQLAAFVSGLLADHRRELGTRAGTRALTCWNQAVFALAWFRDRPDIRRLGAGFGLSQATAYRYKDEAIEVLAAKAPSLREALDMAVEQGLPYLILDGTLISSDRCAGKKTSRKGREIDAWYSGKAHEPAGNVQALAAPGGVPLWVSDVLPGGTHDLTAARELVLPGARAYLRDLPFLADSGYEGAGAGVHVPVKKPARGELDIGHENPERAAALPALPGRTRLRADVSAVARPAARHGQPDHDRRPRQSRGRPGAIRAQDDQLTPFTVSTTPPRVTRGPLPSVPNEETGGPHPFRRDHRAVAHEKGQPLRAALTTSAASVTQTRPYIVILSDRAQPATPGPCHHTTTKAASPVPGTAGQPRGAPGTPGHSSIAATPPTAKPQVQVERPQRSEDERPGGAARRRPYSAPRKARGQAT